MKFLDFSKHFKKSHLFSVLTRWAVKRFGRLAVNPRHSTTYIKINVKCLPFFPSRQTYLYINHRLYRPSKNLQLNNGPNP